MGDFVYLADLLHKGRVGEHTVAFRGPVPIPFSSFERDVAAWYGVFSAHLGTKFALYFQDSYAFVTALFGAWHAKKAVYLLADVMPENLAGVATDVDGFAGDIPGYSCINPVKVSTLPEWQTLDPQARALVVYTSGSSGAPVAIGKRLSQIFDEVTSLTLCFDGRFGDARMCATVSHQHIYGLLFGVLLPLACGRPFSTQRLALAEDVAAELASGGSYVLITSPAHLKRLPDHVPWQAARSNLRVVFSSGGPLPDTALPSCLKLLGHIPIEVYGSSETGGVAWRQRQQDSGSEWQALPGVSIKVEADALQVRSPHSDSSGWQVMPDRVRLLNGGFELLGRSDRIVKIEEKRVSLNTVEHALIATGLLTEVRVLVQTERRTQLIVVAAPSDEGWHLFDSGGKSLLNARLRAALETVVEASVLPRRWRYVSLLPTNPQGKTTEAALLALFDRRRPHARILTRSANAVSLQIEISPTSPYFKGHFPDAPILPGVAQLDWAVLFGREFFELPPTFLRMEAVKFQQVIKPGMDIEMALAFEADRGRLCFALTSTAGSHASGRVVFGSVG